jgi:predicted  nucleic acid-binding Zn-ribbon protein
MRQSEYNKINASLDRAEFALEALSKRADELRNKMASAQSPSEIVALKTEAAELEQQLRNISDAVHTGRPAPHLRLVRDKD